MIIFIPKIHVKSKELEVEKYARKASFHIYGFCIIFGRKFCSFLMRGFEPPNTIHT